jgi:hypothetical protein
LELGRKKVLVILFWLVGMLVDGMLVDELVDGMVVGVTEQHVVRERVKVVEFEQLEMEELVVLVQRTRLQGVYNPKPLTILG